MRQRGGSEARLFSFLSAVPLSTFDFPHLAPLSASRLILPLFPYLFISWTVARGSELSTRLNNHRQPCRTLNCQYLSRRSRSLAFLSFLCFYVSFSLPLSRNMRLTISETVPSLNFSCTSGAAASVERKNSRPLPTKLSRSVLLPKICSIRVLTGFLPARSRRCLVLPRFSDRAKWG